MKKISYNTLCLRGETELKHGFLKPAQKQNLFKFTAAFRNMMQLCNPGLCHLSFPVLLHGKYWLSLCCLQFFHHPPLFSLAPAPVVQIVSSIKNVKGQRLSLRWKNKCHRFKCVVITARRKVFPQQHPLNLLQRKHSMIFTGEENIFLKD